MTDAEGTSAPVDAAPAAPAGDSGPEAVAAPQGGNPNYDNIRSKLGPSFSLVENDLKEMDRLANERITKSNADAEKYSKLGDFDSLQQAYQLQQLLNQDPLSVHTRLTEFLRSQGKLPPEVQAAIDQSAEEDGEQPQTNPELAELKASQQKIQDFLESQQREAEEAKAVAEFEMQMQSIRQQNPHFTDADENRIYRLAYATATSNDAEPDLAAAAAELNQLRTDLLSAPRAGDSAPRLVPTGGGTPPRGDAPNYAKQNSQQTQQSVVELLRANKAALGQ